MKLEDVYKKIDSLNETQTKELNEIASMNISMSGDTADDVGKLMQMMKLAGLDDAGPVGPTIPSSPCGKPVGGDMPVNPRPDDVEKFKSHQHDDPTIPGQDDVAGDQDLNAGPIGALVGAGLGYGGAKAAGLGALGTVGSSLAGGYVGDKATDDESLNAAMQQDPRSELEKFRDIIDAGDEPATDTEIVDTEKTDYANQPDEKYGDTKLMTKDLAGGLNGPKDSYPKVAGGDNPMSIRAELTRLENDIKGKLAASLKEKLSGDK